MNIAKKLKQRGEHTGQHEGFALPTVLIISVVLLAIAVSVLQLSASISRSLTDQHWNRLAKVAAQSGVAFASSCLQKDITYWSSNLTPNTDCNGSPASPAHVFIGSDTSATASPGRWRSTYSIGQPTNTVDAVPRAQITGTVEVLGANAANTVVKTYSYTYNAVLSINRAVTQISASKEDPGFSCMVTTSQLVYCTGSNQWGQLGDGTTAQHLNPRPFGGNVVDPTFVKKFVQASAGGHHACALTTEQEIYCAGDNIRGQLATGDLIEHHSPVLAFSDPTSPAFGKKFTQVSAGGSHTCGVTTEQEVFCAGYNNSSQLGDSSLSAVVNSPKGVKFAAQPGPPSPAFGKKFTKVSAGGAQTCVLSTEQLVYCVGYNLFGQLGSGSGALQIKDPVKFGQIGVAAPKLFTQLSSGGRHTCAVSTEQLIYCAGANAKGQLAASDNGGTSAPVLAFSAGLYTVGKKFTQVEANGSDPSDDDHYFSCALSTEQLVYCAGSNTTYELGYHGVGGSGYMGSATPCNTSSFMCDAVPFGGVDAPTVGKTYSQVTAGEFHGCALGLDQVAYCSGLNTTGQHGDGTTTSSNKPDVGMFLL